VLPLQQTYNHEELSWAEHKTRIEGFNDNLPEIAADYFCHLDWKGDGQTKFLASNEKRKGFHWMPIETALLHQFFMPNKGGLPKLFVWDVDRPGDDGYRVMGVTPVAIVGNLENGHSHVQWPTVYTREELYDKSGTRKRLRRALNIFKFLGYCDPGYQLTGTRSPLWCFGAHYKNGPSNADGPVTRTNRKTGKTSTKAQWSMPDYLPWHHDVTWSDQWEPVSVTTICKVAERLLDGREEELQAFVRRRVRVQKATEKAIASDAHFRDMDVEAFKAMHGIVLDESVYEAEGNIIRLNTSIGPVSFSSDYESVTTVGHSEKPSRNKDTFDWLRLQVYKMYRTGVTETELYNRGFKLAQVNPFDADKWDLPCITKSIVHFVMYSHHELAVKIRDGLFKAYDPYAALRPYRHVGPTAEEKAKDAGVSRSTYFRRQKEIVSFSSDYESVTNSGTPAKTRGNPKFKKTTTTGQEKDVINWHRLGKSIRWIATETGLSKSTVQRLLSNNKSEVSHAA
jgi:DNA-binding CsgD family transcriptional regulator